MNVAEVTVVQARGCYLATCTVHGVLPIYWANPLGAALDAMGHAAHHHRRETPAPATG